MPAAYTHRVYGEKVYDQLSDEIKEKINPYRAYYDLGLHGPDILFFHQFYKSNPVMKKGYAMHNQMARAFFEKSRTTILNSNNPDAALAYILGFINHFVLDSECHGLINQQEVELPISHSELESEFDSYILREQGLDHVGTSVVSHILVNQLDAQVIAEFFEIEVSEAKTSIKSMKWLLDFLVAPGKLKRKFIYSVMKAVGYYDAYQGLVFNYEVNPRCAEVVKILRGKMDHAIPDSVKCINEYVTTLNSVQPLSNRFDHDYEGR